MKKERIEKANKLLSDIKILDTANSMAYYHNNWFIKKIYPERKPYDYLEDLSNKEKDIINNLLHNHIKERLKILSLEIELL